MKKIIGWIIILILTLGSIMIVKEKTEIYNIGNKDGNTEFKIKYKGLKSAVDFTMMKNKVYIAYPHEIKCIENGKEPYTILQDESLNIACLEIVSENIYFISGSKLMSIDINNSNVKELISNLPNTGDYKDVLLKAYKDNIFITIGAMTNSGVVGEDNVWVQDNPEGYDLSPGTIKLRENSIGAFVSRGKSNTTGQVIKGEPIGNSSILSFNINTSECKTYAWGIRNIKGIDISEDGKIFVTVGGYESRGERPIENDSDYIYEIKKEHWYGFPDYSGGDPLNSPRFSKSQNKTKLLLAEYPMNPPAPYYQYNNTDSLESIAIDNHGLVAKNNQSSMFFYNNENNTIYCGIIGGVFEPFVALNHNAVVSSMKIFNDELFVLDSNSGFLFTIESES